MNDLPIAQVSKEASPVFARVLGKLDTLGEAKRRGHIIGVAGCRKGDGATYVARGLAKNLARSGKRALFAEAPHLLQALAGPPADLLSLCVFTEQIGLWRMERPKKQSASRSAEASLRTQLELLWRQVDCLVLDLGAATTSGHISRFVPELDDTLLVVAAGETRRSQITYACNLIAEAGGKLTGCVLNKRTYPVPPRIFRALH